jgi:indolepyruvate ferredoxin oxidoreductase beta subunit
LRTLRLCLSIRRDRRRLSRLKEFNIVLAGVGGQGTLLAAEILGVAAVYDGLNVRVSEIHGMAQRGGAVVSAVRIGEQVSAPTVLEGQADVLLGFEPLETLRSLKCASEKTTVLMSDQKLPPTELASKNVKYPDMSDIIKKIGIFTENIIVVKAERLAKQAGSALTQNVVLIGALSAAVKLPLKNESLVNAIRELVPKKHLNVNMKAFQLGYGSVNKT